MRSRLRSVFKKTYWDGKPRQFLENEFMRSPEDGVLHPSRQWVRDWLSDRPGMEMLDVGCGPAVELEGFLHYGTPVRWTGVDFSRSMLEVVRRRFPSASVRRGDASHLPFGAGSFDVVLLRHVLEHVSDYQAVLRESLRVTRSWVLVVLFLEPYYDERRPIGSGAWENRLDRRELSAFLDELQVSHSWHTIPYTAAVPPYLEPNEIIVVGGPSAVE